MNGTTSAIRVRTRYGDVDDFVVGYSPFFDARGIFIRTRRLQEVGSRLRFELQLADGSSVFRGEGVVDEVREPPRSATGMHVRITKLDRDSKGLFERITAERNAEVARKSPAPPAAPRSSAVVLGGAAAEPRREASPPDLSIRTPSGPIELFEDVPSGRAEIPEAARAARSELSGALLDEIADGIEMTLDSVLVSGRVDPAGAADLGGFFGSPAELAASGMHGAVSGSFAASLGPVPLHAPSVADQLAAFEADLASESGEVPALAPVAPEPELFQHQSPAEAVYEHSQSDQFLAASHEYAGTVPGLQHGSGLAESEHEEPSFELPSFDQPAALARDLPPPSRDLPPPSRDLPPPAARPIPPREDHAPLAPRPPRDDDDSDLPLGDVSLAVASNVQFTPPGGVDAVSLFAATEARTDTGDADVVEGDLVDEGDEGDEDVLDALPEPSRPDARVLQPATSPAAPAPQEEPSALAAAAAKSHFRLRDEGGPALDDLLLDILEENRSSVVTSSGNMPALLVGGDDDGEGGPDAIDELLARESAEQEGIGKKKKGLFSRLFGRK